MIFLTGVLGAGVTAPGMAQETWDFTPRVNMHGTYTDNVGLRSDENKRGDWIGQVNPGFSLSRAARRLDLNLDYSMRNRWYLHESRRNRTSHRVLGNGTLEAIRNRGFVDFGIVRREQVPSLLDPAGIQPEVGAQTIDTSQFSVSPYGIQRFGRLATATARYRLDERRYHGSGLDDNRSHQYIGRLESGRAFQTFFWNLDYSHEDVEYLEGDRLDVTFSSYSGTLGYHVNPRLRVFGILGREHNDFQTNFRDDIDGEFWHAGFAWSPSRRTNLRATYGERFFGSTGSVNLTHRTRKTRWNLQYDETLSLGRGIEADVIESAEDLANIDPESGPGFLDVQDGELVWLSLTDQTYIQERLQGSVRLYHGHSQFTGRVFRVERDFQLDRHDREQRHGGALSWRWDFAPRMYSHLTSGWYRTDFERTEQREDDTWYARASLNRNFQPNVRGSLSYRYQQRDSSDAAHDYVENAVTASLYVTF